MHILPVGDHAVFVPFIPDVKRQIVVYRSVSPPEEYRIGIDVHEYPRAAEFMHKPDVPSAGNNLKAERYLKPVVKRQKALPLHRSIAAVGLYSDGHSPVLRGYSPAVAVYCPLCVPGRKRIVKRPVRAVGLCVKVKISLRIDGLLRLFGSGCSCHGVIISRCFFSVPAPAAGRKQHRGGKKKRYRSFRFFHFLFPPVTAHILKSKYRSL